MARDGPVARGAVGRPKRGVVSEHARENSEFASTFHGLGWFHTRFCPVLAPETEKRALSPQDCPSAGRGTRIGQESEEQRWRSIHRWHAKATYGRGRTGVRRSFQLGPCSVGAILRRFRPDAFGFFAVSAVIPVTGEIDEGGRPVQASGNCSSPGLCPLLVSGRGGS